MASKLYQPAAPPRRVARPQLLQRFYAGLTIGRSITLISAPSGYGKSTLVAAWLADSPRPIPCHAAGLPDCSSSPLPFSHLPG